MALKSTLKRLLSYGPYRVARGAGNRFDAMGDCLRGLARRTFAPSLIIDVGAFRGTFALMANKVFPAAAIHMVEPQPMCTPDLRQLSNRPGFFFYPVAVTSRTRPVRMIVKSGADTGAHIAWAANQDEANLEVRGTTLDELFNDRCGLGERILLKLDLQGHELLALEGAPQLLPKVEAVLLEVSFFQQVGEPTIPKIVAFFDVAGFDLYDVGALAGRTRDGRLRQGDFVFVRRTSPLWLDRSWA